ncbi:MAG: hypothetical protein COA58_02500 [Bacteroidetes bacterium]|nr:MAG: hypothetical protein COA58_02500 [Bacteroidota bacterium]
MELSLSVILVIVGAFILLKYARKLVSKIIGVVGITAGILGFMYYKSIGPFKNNVADISHLEEKYCGSDGDRDICDCILKPAKQDIASRFSSKEIDNLSNEKIKAVYVLQKSLAATKEQALACLTLKGESKKYKVFLQDFIPIENRYLDLAGEKIKDLGEKVRKEVHTFNENKEDIDNKY